MSVFQGFQIGDLNVRLPLVQGGMGIGVSMERLASAVAREGGIGVLSAAQPGYREADFRQHTKEANLRALGAAIHRAKEAAKGGVIGVNIMCAADGYEDYVRCCVENGADLIVSGAGVPAELPAYVGDSGIKLAPIVSPPKAARVLLKLWDKHYHRTADLVVIEGPEAGGHLGYSAEEVAEIRSRGKYGYDDEIREILSIVKGYEEAYEKKIPVVFGGGVFDRQDIEHYLSLGLSGVQMATRFVVTEECDAAQAFKDAYLHCREDEIEIVQSPVGMPGRAIRNAFLDRAKAGRIPPKNCWHCLRRCNPGQTPYCITQALVNAVTGNTEEALIFCGANAWRLKEMTTVQELIRELFG